MIITVAEVVGTECIPCRLPSRPLHPLIPCLLPLPSRPLIPLITCLSPLQDAIQALPANQRPQVFVSSSAVGFYGISQTSTFNEESASGRDYLSQVGDVVVVGCGGGQRVEEGRGGGKESASRCDYPSQVGGVVVVAGQQVGGRGANGLWGLLGGLGAG